MAPPATGLLLPSGPWALVEPVVAAAASDGVDALWVRDDGAPTARLAVLGRRYAGRLGLVVDPERRLPSVLAKELASLDRLVEGRLEVAVPAWSEAGLDTLEVFTGLWSPRPFSYRGVTIALEDARCLPGPRQVPRPRLWALGRSAPSGRAAELADGWLVAGARPGRPSPAVTDYRRREGALVGVVVPDGPGADPGAWWAEEADLVLRDPEAR
ncbi:MAG TPA: LLM class flavin-dependent oxidoreductase [Acidimicrobiales bacterium]|nr:LLM class flavin-dependent oxidoreductase [Acidimicrobiales bacterium]